VNRYIWRVMVDDSPVRHYHTLRAATHRACEWSTRAGYEGADIRVERSEPVKFEDERGGVAVYGVFRNGVRL
jgi:hypothetical protein